MTIALIGGSGFIGTRLAEMLDKNAVDFFILDKVSSTVFPDHVRLADVRNLEVLSRELRGADLIVNLAAEHRDDVTPVSLYTEVNVTGAENICKAATDNGIHRIIFTSSVAVYGDAAPFSDENSPCNPYNEYGRTKLEAEKVFRTWETGDSRNCLAIVRPTVVFGEGNRGNVYNLLNQIAAGHFLFVGSGKNHKAMAYVGNVAAFIWHLIKLSDMSGTWNYVDTPIMDMNSLVKQIRRCLGFRENTGMRIPALLGLLGGGLFDITASLTGKRFPISLIRIRKFMADSSFSSERALEIQFQPPYELKKSLDNVISHEFPGLNQRNSKDRYL